MSIKVAAFLAFRHLEIAEMQPVPHGSCNAMNEVSIVTAQLNHYTIWEQHDKKFLVGVMSLLTCVMVESGCDKRSEPTLNEMMGRKVLAE